MTTFKPPAEWVPIEDLIPWKRNPKDHGDEDTAGLARSIARFGFADPIVAWRSTRQIVSGHGRLLSAALLMREDTGRLMASDAPGPGVVPVRWMEFANQREADAYAVAANRWTERNPMNDDRVAEILRELEAEGVSLDGIGYELSELKAMTDQVGVDDVRWKEFDETIGDDAPGGKQVKCPHCGEAFEV